MRESGGGDKQRRRNATQEQVLAEEIRQFGPSHGLGESEKRFLRLLQLRNLAAIAAMVVVMVLKIVMIMIMIFELMMVMIVTVIGGLRGATEIGEIEASSREGSESYGRKSQSRVEENRSGRVDEDAPFTTQQERIVLADADRIRKSFHLRC